MTIWSVFQNPVTYMILSSKAKQLIASHIYTAVMSTKLASHLVTIQIIALHFPILHLIHW